MLLLKTGRYVPKSGVISSTGPDPHSGSGCRWRLWPLAGIYLPVKYFYRTEKIAYLWDSPLLLGKPVSNLGCPI